MQHQNRIPRSPEKKVRFECGRSWLVCETKVAFLMHERSCVGGSVEGSRYGCSVSGVWMSLTVYNIFVLNCGLTEREATVSGESTRK